jgi:hypothetical protein
MQGQANHFIRYSLATEPIPYAIDRYKNETRRLYRTVDNSLAQSRSDYIVGNKCTIADMALWCWVNSASEYFSVTFFWCCMRWCTREKVLLILEKSSPKSTSQSSLLCRFGMREWHRGQRCRRDIMSQVALI